jgi:hypothetical protein
MNIRYFLFILGFLCDLGIQADTIKISNLVDPVSGKKVIIIYDLHLEQVADAERINISQMVIDKATQKSQEQDLEKLADLLANHKEKVLFVSECTELRMGEISLGLTDDCKDTLLIIPRILIKKATNPLGNLHVLFADPRSHIDIYAATNFVTQHMQLKKALDEGKLPSSLKTITVGSYMSHIEDVKNQILYLVDQEETFDNTIKTKIKTHLNNLYNAIYTHITMALETYSLKDTNHLLDLYAKELAKNDYSLINNIVDFGNVNFDSALLFHLNTTEHKTIVVQAGGLHATLLENRLIRNKFELRHTKGMMIPHSIDNNDYVHTQKVTKYPRALEHVDEEIKEYLG